MMNKNGFYTFFILFFMTICMVFSLGMFVVEQPKPRANEILAAKPLLKSPDGNFNKNYFQDLTNYVGDHFAFRAELITIHNRIVSNVFASSASKDVLLGKDGWLFYKDTQDDYLGRNVMSDDDIAMIARNIKMIQNYVEQQGADFLFFIAPNKNSLYGEYMPDLGEKFSNESNAQKLMAALEQQQVHYINFFELFQNQNEILYHRLDSHWNNKGAALARDTILSALDIEYDINWYDADYHIEKNHKGDLYEMLYPTGKELDNQVVFEKQFDFVADNEIHGADDIQIDTTNAQKEHSLLLFRDSFGNALYPFLADSFGHSRFSRKMPYPLAMMEEVNADVVIIEIVERNINNLAKNAPIMPSPLVEWDIDAQKIETEVEILPEQNNLQGYCCVQGNIEQKANVYVQWQDCLYDTFIIKKENGYGFVAYVPEGSEQDFQGIWISN